MARIQVFVRLLDEGTDVWRPVDAEFEGTDTYRIVAENPDPQDENWEFEVGNLVRCREHKFANRKLGLVAFEEARKKNV